MTTNTDTDDSTDNSEYTWHADLPWSELRAAIRRFRARYFEAPRPEGYYLMVKGVTVEDIRRDLGQQGYAPNWEFSFHKRGEVLNLARVQYHESEELPPTDDKPGRVWWQTHVRGWPHPDGLALKAHWELEPTENGTEHILSEGFDGPEGMKRLRKRLKRASYTPDQYQLIRWSEEKGYHGLAHRQDE